MKSRKSRISRIAKIAVIAFLTVAAYFSIGTSRNGQNIEWGVTFSRAQAEYLGLDWRETYLAILDDLGADNLRLSAYWNEVEPEQGKFDFRELDFQIDEASERGAKILLAVGRRLPRWPECHEPEWVRNQNVNIKNQNLLNYIEEVVNRYRNNDAIWAWQVENEIYLTGFGECPPPDSDLFEREIELVKSLDDRPVVTADSGELGDWARTMSRGDIFGTTMYRRVYNPRWGFAIYPLPPIYYQRRFNLFNIFFRNDDIINVELQAEPWSVRNYLPGDSTRDWNETLSPAHFRGNIDYARRSGISPAYLWGAEWWYYAYRERRVEDYWEIAGELWRN